MFSTTLNMLDRVQMNSRGIEPHRQVKQEPVEEPKSEKARPVEQEEEKTVLQKLEQEIAAAAGLVRPLNSMQHPDPVPPGPFFEELLRAIENLRKPDESRVVDVFE